MSDLSRRFEELIACMARTDAQLFRTIGEQNAALHRVADPVQHHRPSAALIDRKAKAVHRRPGCRRFATQGRMQPEPTQKAFPYLGPGTSLPGGAAGSASKRQRTVHLEAGAANGRNRTVAAGATFRVPWRQAWQWRGHGRHGAAATDATGAHGATAEAFGVAVASGAGAAVRCCRPATKLTS